MQLQPIQHHRVWASIKAVKTRDGPREVAWPVSDPTIATLFVARQSRSRLATPRCEDSDAPSLGPRGGCSWLDPSAVRIPQHKRPKGNPDRSDSRCEPSRSPELTGRVKPDTVWPELRRLLRHTAPEFPLLHEVAPRDTASSRSLVDMAPRDPTLPYAIRSEQRRSPRCEVYRHPSQSPGARHRAHRGIRLNLGLTRSRYQRLRGSPGNQGWSPRRHRQSRRSSDPWQRRP